MQGIYLHDPPLAIIRPDQQLVPAGGPVACCYRDLSSAGRFVAAELLTTYSSLRLQAVDARVIALAERLDLRGVAALDRRDFQVVAPRHLPKGQRLKLLPED